MLTATAELVAVNRIPEGAKRLRLQGDTLQPHAELRRNCFIAASSGFPILTKAGAIKDNPCVIVGSSPDLPQHLNDIGEHKQAGAHIMSVKGAHDFLLANGITPDSAVYADAQPRRVKILAQPRLGITYYLAAQCHRDMWDYMRGMNVVIWYPLMSNGEQVEPKMFGIPRVPGGNTTGLRAIALAWILGYRHVIIVGFASCFDQHTLRADGSGADDYDPPFKVCFANCWFTSNTSLTQQTVDLMSTLQFCPGIKVDAIGDGMLPHVLRAGKACGWPV